MTPSSWGCPPLSRSDMQHDTTGVSLSQLVVSHPPPESIKSCRTSFIPTSAFLLTPHFLPERNLPWHMWLPKSFSLSFPIIVIQLWWSLILLHRRQGEKFSLSMSFAVCGITYVLVWNSNFYSSTTLCTSTEEEKRPWSRQKREYNNLMNVMFWGLHIGHETYALSLHNKQTTKWRKNQAA